MTEADFDQLLEAVKTAIEVAPTEDTLPFVARIYSRPEAANDNQAAWPLIPFPDGWWASC
jgi:hypothetical protein